ADEQNLQAVTSLNHRILNYMVQASFGAIISARHRGDPPHLAGAGKFRRCPLGTSSIPANRICMV
ncbi:MAG: hypothetical protein LUC06_08005, partial [Oscillospiraceae bacterium]|nr:hypothetical protein [Oscillospiraceae bacterium]